MLLLRTQILGSLSLTALMAFCGCGSEVNGGSGGSGGAGGSGGNSAQGVQVCYDFCHAMEVNNCPSAPANCTSECDDMFAEIPAECVDEFSVALSCWKDAAASCPSDPPAACEPLIQAAETCKSTYGCSSTGTCWGSSGGGGSGGSGVSQCGCDEMCKQKKYETSCTLDATTATCDCLVDGVSVGTCTEPAADSCHSPTNGCCNQFFQL